MWTHHAAASMTRGIRRWMTLGLVLSGLLMLGACGMLMGMMHGSVERPAAEEFGFGPRGSHNGLYRATLDPVQPIKVGRMQTMRLRVQDAAGHTVDGASITLNGGMPQHGHGLPTRPRVTRSPSEGAYAVEGMKFNMGGWWVVTFHIATDAGRDSITFNLDL